MKTFKPMKEINKILLLSSMERKLEDPRRERTEALIEAMESGKILTEYIPEKKHQEMKRQTPTTPKPETKQTEPELYYKGVRIKYC